MSRRRCSELLLETPGGPARAYVHPAPARATRATLVLGHGAGAGVQRSGDLLALAAALPARGVSVVLVDQPWVVAGRRVAAAPPRLDAAWCAVLPRLPVSGPLVVGGRSAGARVACRTAGSVGASACVALAFPLHPPGRPERSRVAELTAVDVPLLVVQGTRDSFGGPERFPPSLDVRTVPGDHGFAVPARSGTTRADVHAAIVGLVADWVDGLTGRTGS